MISIPSSVRAAGKAVREILFLFAFLSVLYFTLIAPPMLVVTYISTTPLLVWALVVTVEFVAGFGVNLLGALFNTTFSIGPVLLLLGMLNFVGLPLYILLGL